MCPSIFLKDKVLKQQKKNFYMYFINKGLEISEKDNVRNISREIQSINGNNLLLYIYLISALNSTGLELRSKVPTMQI